MLNQQYNRLVHWADGKNDSSTKRLMFQVLFFFHKILQNSLQKPFQLFFLFFYKITEMKIKSFECPKSIRNYEKKILGTSDGWSTSRLSHWPSEPAYYIVDCRILGLCGGDDLLRQHHEIQCNGANELSTNEESPNLRLHNRAKNFRQVFFIYPRKREKVIVIIT